MARMLKRVPQLCQIGYCGWPSVRPAVGRNVVRLCYHKPDQWVTPYVERTYKKQDRVPEDFVLIYDWTDVKLTRCAHGFATLCGFLAIFITVKHFEVRIKEYNEMKEEEKNQAVELTQMDNAIKFMRHFGEAILGTICLLVYIPLLRFLFSSIPCRVYFNQELDTYIAMFIKNAFKIVRVTIPTKDIRNMFKVGDTEFVKFQGRYAILRMAHFRTPLDFQRMARLVVD